MDILGAIVGGTLICLAFMFGVYALMNYPQTIFVFVLAIAVGIGTTLVGESMRK